MYIPHHMILDVADVIQAARAGGLSPQQEAETRMDYLKIPKHDQRRTYRLADAETATRRRIAQQEEHDRRQAEQDAYDDRWGDPLNTTPEEA